ncbi:MAG: hypothetical protein GY906_11555 [bacterium]|nr:hypothetical protein [bacterium]
MVLRIPEQWIVRTIDRLDVVDHLGGYHFSDLCMVLKRITTNRMEAAIPLAVLLPSIAIATRSRATSTLVMLSPVLAQVLLAVTLSAVNQLRTPRA